MRAFAFCIRARNFSIRFHRARILDKPQQINTSGNVDRVNSNPVLKAYSGALGCFGGVGGLAALLLPGPLERN